MVPGEAQKGMNAFRCMAGAIQSQERASVYLPAVPWITMKPSPTDTAECDLAQEEKQCECLTISVLPRMTTPLGKGLCGRRRRLSLRQLVLTPSRADGGRWDEVSTVKMHIVWESWFALSYCL